MSSSNSLVSDASGPPEPISVDALIASMAALLPDDLEDLFAIPWLVDDSCELTQGLEDRSGELTPLQHG
ncbi:hypothetical protein A2U01_0077941, partial [Trifolium medium]|nr:hypothetical protein [Trifolium medium]